VSGLIRWTRVDGRVLRLAGWLAMAVAAAVPSHLTLLLPVAALLTLTLSRQSEEPAVSHPGGAAEPPAAS
jgi:hypothetical protein